MSPSGGGRRHGRRRRRLAGGSLRGDPGQLLRLGEEGQGLLELNVPLEADPVAGVAAVDGVRDLLADRPVDLGRVLLREEIANAVYGRDAGYRIGLEGDVQFQKALTLFPEAEKLAGIAPKGSPGQTAAACLLYTSPSPRD